MGVHCQARRRSFHVPYVQVHIPTVTRRLPNPARLLMLPHFLLHPSTHLSDLFATEITRSESAYAIVSCVEAAPRLIPHR
jgi:hypothetical protein